MNGKKLLSALLALFMLMPLASCSNTPQNDTQQNTSTQNSTDSEQENSENIAQQNSEASSSQPDKPDNNHADSQPKIVFENGGKTFYASRIFYYLNDESDDSAVIVQSPTESTPYFNISSKSLAFCGTEFYGVEHGSCNSVIWHVYADETGSINKDMIYTAAQLKTAAVKYCNKDIAAEEITHAAEAAFTDEVRSIIAEDYNSQYEKPFEQTQSRPDDLPAYGEFEAEHIQEYLGRNRDSLYQKHYETAEQNYWNEITDSLCYNIIEPVDGGDGYIYASLYFNRNRCLIRFAKDGSKYEIFDDIILSSFTISDGWLYYYDSGAGKADIDGKISYDPKRRGIYKMRLDGSKKSKLYGDITLKIGTGSWYDENEYSNAVIKMRAAGNDIYYLLANEEGRNYHLYRMPAAGGTPELCAPINCYGYTVDDSGNILCCYGCEENLPLDELILKENKDKLKLVLKNLSEGTEKIIPTNQIVNYEYNDEMQIVGNMLYISSYHFSEGKDIDTSETGYERAYTAEGEMLKITEPEYRINNYARAGLRIDLTDGKTEWLLRCRFCDLSSGSFEEAIEEAKKPWKTVWKDADKMDEELNAIIKKYNIDVNYQEPPVY